MTYKKWPSHLGEFNADPWDELKKSALRTSRWMIAGIVAGIVTSFATGDLPFWIVAIAVTGAYCLGIFSDLVLKAALREPDTETEKES